MHQECCLPCNFHFLDLFDIYFSDSFQVNFLFEDAWYPSLTALLKTVTVKIFSLLYVFYDYLSFYTKFYGF